MPRYLVIPEADGDNLQNATIHNSNSLSGLTNGVSYIAYALSSASPVFTPNTVVVVPEEPEEPEEPEPEEPTEPTDPGEAGPLFPFLVPSAAIGMAGHSSLNEIRDGGNFDNYWQGNIYQAINADGYHSRDYWNLNGPERNNPINVMIVSEMDEDDRGRYAHPDSDQGRVNLQHLYWYGLTARNQNAPLIIYWHATPRDSHSISWEHNKTVINYYRQWLSQKLGVTVFVMPIDIAISKLREDYSDTQIWQDFVHLQPAVRPINRYMLYRMLTGQTLEVLAGEELLNQCAMEALDEYRWGGTGGIGNDEVLDITDPLPNPLPIIGEFARTASTATDRHVHSGHSLTDVYANMGIQGWPGNIGYFYEAQFEGRAAYDHHDQNTIPGSPLFVRWNDARPERDARTNIDEYQVLTITESGPPGRPGVNDVTNTLDYLMRFVDRAYRVGNGGQGAEVILWSIWPNVEGWMGPEYQTNSNWTEFGGFRGALEEYGRVFRYFADYVTWKMHQIHPELPADWRVWLMPGHAWWARVYDDIQLGLVPGITNHTQLFGDDIHPDEVGAYGLSIFVYTCLYQVDTRLNSFIPNEGVIDTELDQYFRRIAWELATEHASIGMGGSLVYEPEYDPADGDPLPNWVSEDGPTDPPEEPEEPGDPDPEEPGTGTLPEEGLIFELDSPFVMDGTTLLTRSASEDSAEGRPLYVAIRVTAAPEQVTPNGTIFQLRTAEGVIQLSAAYQTGFNGVMLRNGVEGSGHMVAGYPASAIAAGESMIFELFIDPSQTPNTQLFSNFASPSGTTANLILSGPPVTNIRFGTPDWGGEVFTGVISKMRVYDRVPDTIERNAIRAWLEELSAE